MATGGKGGAKAREPMFNARYTTTGAASAGGSITPSVGTPGAAAAVVVDPNPNLYFTQALATFGTGSSVQVRRTVPVNVLGIMVLAGGTNAPAGLEVDYAARMTT